MKLYLGDSVYADVNANPGHITLTTENGYGPSNTIHLNDEVIGNLNNFLSYVTEKQEKQDDI